MKKKFVLLVILCMGVFHLYGQYDLNNGSYIFNEFNSNIPAGTYPSFMEFYYLASTNDPSQQTALADLYENAYNLTSSSRIRALGTDGFSMINTANSTHHPLGYQLGAAVLKLNTEDRHSISLDWTVKTIQAGGGRKYCYQLFYRIGNAGPWEIALDNNQEEVIYTSENTNNAETIMPIWNFPPALENLPHVELMWKFYESSASTNTGTRAQIAIKYIEIQSLGLYNPNFDWQFFKDYAIEQEGLDYVDSFMFYYEDALDDFSIAVNPEFQISLETNGTYSPSINYAINNQTEDSFRVYIKRITGQTGWNTLNFEIHHQSFMQQFSYDWYWAESHLPNLFYLQQGDYEFREWGEFEPAGTYPPSMSFQVTEGRDYASLSLPLARDWLCAYDLTSRSRFQGLNQLGIEMRNTASPQYDNCMSGAEDIEQYIGAVTLLLNTEGVDSARLKYYTMVSGLANVVDKRKYALILQYRLSPIDTFMNFPDSSTIHKAYDVLNYNEEWVDMLLPEELMQESFVQLRWLYADLEPGFGTGTHPAFRLDEIEVIGLLDNEDENNDEDEDEEEDEDGISVQELNQGIFVIYPNPVESGGLLYFSEKINGNLYNDLGQKILEIKQQDFLIVPNLVSGIYFLHTEEGRLWKIVIY